jgi:hypothetical protein
MIRNFFKDDIFVAIFTSPWEQMMTMNKSSILLVNDWWSQLTSTSYCCELFMKTENLHQEILDYLIPYILSRSIPHSDGYGESFGKKSWII